MEYRTRLGAAFIMLLLMHGAARPEQLPRESAFPKFAVTPGKLDADGLPVSAAKLCALGGAPCFTMPSESAGDNVTYQFGLDPRAERLPAAGGSWIFFSATFSGGGSGTLERIAVLRFRKDKDGGRIVNVMPYIAVTNVSDRAMWSVPSVSGYPLLVDADFLWGKGETHFAPHFFIVKVWRFDPNTQAYVRAVQYRTPRRYDGGDSSPVRVLEPERTEILRRLGMK